MRQRHNGFVEFMCKLDGKSKVKPKSGHLKDVRILGLGYLECVCEGDTSALIKAFMWKDTTQGHSYWEALWDGLREMTDEDYEFCEALLEAHS